MDTDPDNDYININNDAVEDAAILTSDEKSNNNSAITAAAVAPSSRKRANTSRELFVRNLSESVTENILHSVASQYGSVDSCRIIHYKNSSASREIAYLTMHTQAEADTVKSQLTGALLCGRYITVEQANRWQDKRDFLFPWLSPQQRAEMQLDDVAEYSVSDAENADSVSKIMQLFLPYNSIITDAFSCVGGNAMSFARYFQQVNCIELDKSRYEYLNHNIKVAGYTEKVATFNDSYLNFIASLEQDGIFFDPPWSGTEYYQKQKIQINLPNPSTEKDISMAGIVNSLRFPSVRTKVSVLKLPNNFDFHDFLLEILPNATSMPEEQRNALKVNIAKVKYPKMTLVVLDYCLDNAKFRSLIAGFPVYTTQGITRYYYLNSGKSSVEDIKDLDAAELWEFIPDDNAKSRADLMSTVKIIESSSNEGNRSDYDEENRWRGKRGRFEEEAEFQRQPSGPYSDTNYSPSYDPHYAEYYRWTNWINYNQGNGPPNYDPYGYHHPPPQPSRYAANYPPQHYYPPAHPPSQNDTVLRIIPFSLRQQHQANSSNYASNQSNPAFAEYLEDGEYSSAAVHDDSHNFHAGNSNTVESRQMSSLIDSIKASISDDQEANTPPETEPIDEKLASPPIPAPIVEQELPGPFNTTIVSNAVESEILQQLATLAGLAAESSSAAIKVGLLGNRGRNVELDNNNIDFLVPQELEDENGKSWKHEYSVTWKPDADSYMLFITKLVANPTHFPNESFLLNISPNSPLILRIPHLHCINEKLVGSIFTGEITEDKASSSSSSSSLNNSSVSNGIIRKSTTRFLISDCLYYHNESLKKLPFFDRLKRAREYLSGPQTVSFKQASASNAAQLPNSAYPYHISDRNSSAPLNLYGSAAILPEVKQGSKVHFFKLHEIDLIRKLQVKLPHASANVLFVSNAPLSHNSAAELPLSLTWNPGKSALNEEYLNIFLNNL
jgi:16S rRNA C967 or C1407 C5-methylase (RsmB/RsmF family)